MKKKKERAPQETLIVSGNNHGAEMNAEIIKMLEEENEINLYGIRVIATEPGPLICYLLKNQYDELIASICYTPEERENMGEQGFCEEVAKEVIRTIAEYFGYINLIRMMYIPDELRKDMDWNIANQVLRCFATAFIMFDAWMILPVEIGEGLFASAYEAYKNKDLMKGVVFWDEDVILLSELLDNEIVNNLNYQRRNGKK